MYTSWLLNTFVILSTIIITRTQDLVITNIPANYNEKISLTLNVSNEYVLTFKEVKIANPFRVRAWTSDNTSSQLPVLLVVRQARQVTSWSIPEMIETTKKDKTLYFSNTSKTMCHDSMENIRNENSNFSVGPLIISQSFILAVSTSSPALVPIDIMLEEENSFYVLRNINYTVTVSPSQSKYVYFKFDKNASDTVVISVDSVDDVCLTVSVQDSKCPVMDSNRDIKYEGVYQTMNKKGALTVTKRRYQYGFFLVFVAKPDNYDCSQENSLIPLFRNFLIAENNITSTVSFKITNSISASDYLYSALGTIAIIAVFGVLFTGIIFVFNRFGTISKTKYEQVTVRDYIEPISEDEINKIVLTRDLTVDKFAKYPWRIKQRSFNYLSHTASIALFYSIPVIQLVVTYQRVVNLTGNEDTCYYNFLCAHPALGFSDFNHIFSNVGYIFTGLFFIMAVLDRQHRIKITKEKGIPVHYGLFHAMGVALVIEGILSACYHICPSQSNYQFDTSFMYVMAVLIMVKLYQNRHPDINVTAYSTFSVVGIAIFIAMIGILNGSLFIWIVFILAYGALIILLSLKIYYVNFVINGTKQFYESYKTNGFSKETFVPLRKGRFILLVIINVTNFSILGCGLYIYFNNLTDFGTFLLGLLLANTVLHVTFYTTMKLLHKEKVCFESIIFGILSFGCWIAASIFFFDASTLWTVTPAESRHWNQGCIFLGFYDKHDVWHLLSAPALYFTFLYLLFLDDDLSDKPQKEISVF